MKIDKKYSDKNRHMAMWLENNTGKAINIIVPELTKIHEDTWHWWEKQKDRLYSNLIENITRIKLDNHRLAKDMESMRMENIRLKKRVDKVQDFLMGDDYETDNINDIN